MPRRPLRTAAPPTSRQPSLKVTDGFKSFVLAQLEALGDVVARSMFGGVGLYHRGAFFGLMAMDKLFLKVDQETRGDYLRAGMKPFAPYPDRSGTMQYYEVPLSVLESPLELEVWALRAVEAAERTAARPRTRKRLSAR